jgi:hypothetical protein
MAAFSPQKQRLFSGNKKYKAGYMYHTKETVTNNSLFFLCSKVPVSNCNFTVIPYRLNILQSARHWWRLLYGGYRSQSSN